MLALLGAIWAGFVLDRLAGGALTRTLGLVPRDPEGLPGVLAMPFLHQDLSHIATNCLALLVFAALGLWSWGVLAIRAGLAVWPLSGLGLWVFGPGEVIHIGASTLVYGWAACLALGAFAAWRHARLAGLAALALLGIALAGGFGGGALTGPAATAHLAGMAAGAVVALAMRWIGRGRAARSGLP